MLNHSAILMATAMLYGCAQAEGPAPAPVTASAPKSIPDTEPDVTAQVATLLGQLAAGALPQEQLSDNARTALAPQLQQMGAAVRPCGKPIALTLLTRSTKGEDRNYLYRAPCNSNALAVEINFNKAAKISHLAIHPELR